MPTLSLDKLARQLSLDTATTAAAPSSALWHLQSGGSTPGIDAVDAWAYVTGRGVSVGIFDDADKHATAVSGIIGAKPSASAPLGVAYNATLTSYQVIGIPNASIAAVLANAAKFDVANNSWGWDAMLYVNRLSSSWSPFFAAIETAAETGRGGLGTTQVVAACNSRAAGNDANLSSFSNDRHVVTVGAVTSEGKVAYYSNPGASLLVSAPSSGGTRGITTTDLAGSAGYSATDVTNTFGGTSAATPQVTGVVALMLEANPQLGWRDVKTILAMTAEQPAGIGTVTNAGTHWNGGGMMFSNDTGYGVVDARAAVRLAETWTAQSTSWNEVNINVAATGTQTLSASRSISYTFNVAQAIALESAEITLTGSHGRVGDLKIQLISPNGTVSTLLDQKGGSTAFSGFTFSSNTFLGEGGTGQWTLKVSEGAGAATGTFTGATLSLHGSTGSDDTFVFTDAYAGLAGRNVLKSTSGHGTINAAASTGNDVIDLHAGAWSTIAGKAVQISGDSLFTTAIAGDGHVKVIGNDAANLLVAGHGDGNFYGGSGNDIFVSGPGNNVMDGGSGYDLVQYMGGRLAYSVSMTSGGHTVSGASASADTLTNIEAIRFADGTFVFDTGSQAAQVYRMYEAALDRTPEAAGLNNWIVAMKSCLSIADLAKGFVGSIEFQTRYGNLDDRGFVEHIYQDILHRTAADSEVQGWVSVLRAGDSRADVILGFSESAEHIALTRSAVEAGLFVQDEQAYSIARLYHTVLDRNPELNGLKSWTGYLDAGGSLKSVADGFAVSAEFTQRFGALNDHDFVATLYSEGLGRTGSEAEIQGWMGAMHAGMSRGDVALGFSESLEQKYLSQMHQNDGLLIV